MDRGANTLNIDALLAAWRGWLTAG